MRLRLEDAKGFAQKLIDCRSDTPQNAWATKGFLYKVKAAKEIAALTLYSILIA